MLFQRNFGITVKIGHVLSIFQSAIIDNTLVMSVITLVPFVSITKNIVFIKAHTTDPVEIMDIRTEFISMTNPEKEAFQQASTTDESIRIEYA